MDNQRLILYMALAVVVFMLWTAWQRDYGAPPASEPTETRAEGGGPADGAATGGERPEDLPSPPSDAGEADGAPAPEPAAGVAEGPLPSGERVHVTTDAVEVELDTRGGDLRRLSLPLYPVSTDEPDTPYVLMSDDPPRLFVAQSGFLAERGPNHHSRYRAERTEYRLPEGADRLEVPLTWSGDGLEVTKTYTFRRGSYLVDVEHRVRNTGEQPWQGRLYTQLQRTETSQQAAPFLYTYVGGAYYKTAEESMEKVDFDRMREDPLNRSLTGGWAAMLEHYFIGAWVPAQDAEHHYYSKALSDGGYVLGLAAPTVTIPPGESASLSQQFYGGPKDQDLLAGIAPGLDLTIDYGFLTVLSKPLFWLLDSIHSLVGNWGWSIVLLTVLIKLAFYKLSETSYRSMAQMRKVQPRMQAIKEKHGDDRQKMNQALMELYKKEKINPLGGCLPILVQIPVFIALYWVLLESVELRQAPFMLWIDDLSKRDPWFVLPVLMGASMVIQQRLNPSPLDPIQQKIMMVLPVVFTGFFAFFPAGLVLYWLTNNVLSIAQQWFIVRRIENAPSSA